MEPVGRSDWVLVADRVVATFQLDGAAVDHPDHPVRAACDLGVMGDQHDRGTPPVQVLQEFEDDFAGSGVEAAGGLVGEDQPRPIRERPCHRHLLLLATR